MKRILFALVIGLLFLALLPAQEKPDPAAEMMKNLQTVEKIAAVPARLQAGFASINARDLMTLMTFLSHDVLEGREVASPGHDIAAGYARSLFALWGLKPGGDVPNAAPAAFGSDPGRPAPGPERGCLQECAMKEAEP
jgi:hypothetical protein